MTHTKHMFRKAVNIASTLLILGALAAPSAGQDRREQAVRAGRATINALLAMDKKLDSAVVAYLEGGELGPVFMSSNLNYLELKRMFEEWPHGDNWRDGLAVIGSELTSDHRYTLKRMVELEIRRTHYLTELCSFVADNPNKSADDQWNVYMDLYRRYVDARDAARAYFNM